MRTGRERLICKRQNRYGVLYGNHIIHSWAERKEATVEYNVSFGSAFAVDQFGFVRKGKVSAGDTTVTFQGKKSWSTLAKVGIFLLITIVPLVLFGFGLGFILALVVIHYFCASDGSLNIQKASVKAIRRKGRQIKFTGKHPSQERRRRPSSR